MPDTARSIAEWIQRQANLLVCTHVRPDGDAYGSLIGCITALNEAGITCSGFISSALPRRYAQLLSTPENLFIANPLPAGYTSLMCLDTATSDRADTPGGFDPAGAEIPVANVDHHPDNGRYGDVNLIDPSKAATAALLLDVLDALDCSISPPVATSLLTGLVMDCGGFRFRNTDEEALRIAARLVEAGGDLHRVMDRMFFQEPLGVSRLKADLLQNARFTCDGKVAYAVMDSKRRDKYGVRYDETEGVIDVLRSIEGVLIACLIQPQGKTVRLSLRAREPDYPVDEIARTLGGGGHRLAAGAELKNTTVREAETRMVELAKRILR